MFHTVQTFALFASPLRSKDLGRSLRKDLSCLHRFLLLDVLVCFSNDVSALSLDEFIGNTAVNQSCLW